MNICGICKYEKECHVAHDDFCMNYERRPLTNADRIRSMTDEELAEFIVEIELKADCLGGTFGDEYWVEWLKQETKE